MADAEAQKEKTRTDVWYARGLRFGCTRCNRCCTGPPGYVWVHRREIVRIADFLKMPVPDFARQYCRKVWWRVSLKERPNGDCVLLTPEGCRIYPVRPRQCRTFPFWEQNLRSRECWEALKNRCPGVGRGRIYSAQDIRRIMAGKETT